MKIDLNKNLAKGKQSLGIKPQTYNNLDSKTKKPAQNDKAINQTTKDSQISRVPQDSNNNNNDRGRQVS